MGDELLASEEAWQYLGVSRATLWTLIRRHNLPTYKLPLRGKRIFFRRQDLDRLREPIKVERGLTRKEAPDGPTAQAAAD